VEEKVLEILIAETLAEREIALEMMTEAADATMTDVKGLIYSMKYHDDDDVCFSYII
jgi:hypothetical protein